MIGIYILIFPNGKKYVGQSKNIERRLKQYSKLRCNRQPKLYNALCKYEWSAITVEILELPVECLNSAEANLISKYDLVKQGYNCTSGGESPLWSDESKLKAKKTRKKRGIIISSQCREAARQSHLGKPLGEQTKLKMSLSTKGRKMSDKNKKAISDAQKKSSKTKNQILILAEKNSKFFEIVSPEGMTMSGKNLNKFCREHSLNCAHIRSVIKGERPHHKGWTKL